MAHYTFQKEDNSDINFCVVRKPPENIVDHVPAGIYTPNYEQTPFGPVLKGLSFIKDSFKMESDVRYGVFNEIKDTILKEFKNKKLGSTSVLAIGDPGTGKSLMGKDLANYCVRMGMPVLLINQDYPLSDIGNIAKLISPCMVFMDEFGKFYQTSIKDSDGDAVSSTKTHGHLLTLLDDRDLNSVLFYMTSNGDDKNNSLGIINRPGRVKFNLNMRYLESTSLLDCIAKSNMSQKMKNVVCLNAFDRDLNMINKGWSTDIVNYLSEYLVQDKDGYELLAFSAIHNVPTINMRSLVLNTVLKESFINLNPHIDSKNFKSIEITYSNLEQIFAKVILTNGKNTLYHCIPDYIEITRQGMTWGEDKSINGLLLTFTPVKEKAKNKEFQLYFKNDPIIPSAWVSSRRMVIDFESGQKPKEVIISSDNTDSESENSDDSLNSNSSGRIVPGVLPVFRYQY